MERKFCNEVYLVHLQWGLLGALAMRFTWCTCNEVYLVYLQWGVLGALAMRSTWCTCNEVYSVHVKYGFWQNNSNMILPELWMILSKTVLFLLVSVDIILLTDLKTMHVLCKYRNYKLLTYWILYVVYIQPKYLTKRENRLQKLYT